MDSFESCGLDLDCYVFEYLIMFLLDFTVIITQKLPNISGVLVFMVIGEHSLV